MFRLRQRPKGLEFPACEGCNNGTGLSDLVASLMGRMYPNQPDEAGREEIKKLMGAVSNNVPGLLEEMRPSEADQVHARLSILNFPVDGHVLRADGPTMVRHMHTFGAKLGFALHYEAINSRVPDGGGVQSMYFTNVSAARGELPRDIINLLPERKTLQQGQRHVSDQFNYSWLLTEERRHSVFYAVFNDAFAVASVTALDRTEFLDKERRQISGMAPGDFRRLADQSSGAGCPPRGALFWPVVRGGFDVRQPAKLSRYTRSSGGYRLA